MPTISTEQFLKIADRLSAQYELLIQVEELGNLPETKATLRMGTPTKADLFLDPAGTDNIIFLEAVTPGAPGNLITIELIDPSAMDIPLTPSVFGNDMKITLQTDGGSSIVTIAQEMIDLVATFPLFNALVTVAPGVPLTTGLVAAVGPTALTGGTGDEVLDFSATLPGSQGNDLTVEFLDPEVVDSPLTLTLVGTDLIVSLETDDGGILISTAAEIETAIKASFEVSEQFEVDLFGDGTGVVSAIPQSSLSGAFHGPFINSVLQEPPGAGDCTADPDVASQLSVPALNLDQGLTAANFAINIGVIQNFMAALSAHFGATGVVGLTNGFLSTNGIRVHENYSILEGQRTGVNLNAENVFLPDVIVIGTIDITSVPSAVVTPGTPLGTGSGTQSSTNYSAATMEVTLTPSFETAALVMDPGGSDDRVLFTAANPGSFGNTITVEYKDPASDPAPLSVLVVGEVITITLETNGVGTILTTADALITFLTGNAPVEALVTFVKADTLGTGLLIVIAATPLVGGTGPLLEADLDMTISLIDFANLPALVLDVRWDAGTAPGDKQPLALRADITTIAITDVDYQIRLVARVGGADGDNISLELVDPAGPTSPLSVTVTDQKISVSLETSGASALISTATEVRDAILEDSDAFALVFVDLPGTGAGVMGAETETNLDGGLAPKRYLSVTSATLQKDGTPGDQVVMTQVVEREVTV